VTDRNVFFEFVPLDDPEGGRIGIGEVETDRPYLICVTTDAGLWAYQIGDVVRFTSARPPRLVLQGRRRHFLNAFGEHVTEEEIERAVADAAVAHQAAVREFAVVPEYPDARASRGRHAWIVEFDAPPADLRAFAGTIDAALRRGNDDYRAHRAGDRQLLPPAVRPVAPGTFAAWMARHGRTKVPRVIDRAPDGYPDQAGIAASASAVAMTVTPPGLTWPKAASSTGSKPILAPAGTLTPSSTITRRRCAPGPTSAP
jgi:acyl-CoA synthetase (AMP-forming)/AMP-acid ligase II